MIGIDEEVQPDEEPERSEGNRWKERIAIGVKPIKRSGRTNTKITAKFYLAK